MKVEFRLKLDKALYIKDPEETILGKEIVSKSIELIYELGFEKFTLKKLANHINSNEPSIYRYFENKQQLLIYLLSWYWTWIEFNIDNNTRNIKDPRERIKIIIKIISNSLTYDAKFTHINEEKLGLIAIRSYQGLFINKDKNIFSAFDSLCNKVSKVINELDSNYKLPKTIAISLIKIIQEQLFLKFNFPDMTELKDDNDNQVLIAFSEKFIFSFLE
ncbi:MAG: TetR/AcrR family transcriptional regulator [Candidatus Sericytochromatia bacterium]